MEEMCRSTTDIPPEKRTAVRALRGLIAFAFLAAVIGCPQPFQYTRQGWSGNSGTVDPSTPSITAAPGVSYSSSGGSGTLQSGGTATTTADTQITLQTSTVGSVIYYTTDGSNPDPRSSTTNKYSSSITVSLASPTVSNSSIAMTIKAIAIGPNMMPSTVSSAKVTVQYPQAAAPVLSPPAGAYVRTPVSVTLSSATAGSTIYYTTASGTGPAPLPVPGQPGTTQYSGAISLAMPGAIAAVAIHGQMIDSVTSNGAYTVDNLTSYATITWPEIALESSQMTSSTINNSNGSQIPVGQIFLYITSSGNYGKLVVTNNNIDGNNGMGFRFTTYNPGGSILATNTAATCRGTYLYDLDAAPAGAETSTGADLWMDNATPTVRSFDPQNGARFLLGGVDPAP